MDIIELKNRITENISKVIFGKEEAIEKLLLSFMIGGHVLLEDVPGTGKTVLARAFAISLGLNFTRVQFTPDLLPTDLTGLSIYDRDKEDFIFKPGPVFTDILLADEINRATPKTQSAILESMAESQVTVDGITHKLSDNFFVMATQNPIEYEGTFPLPEAQLDRFAFMLKIGYPEKEMEMEMLTSQMDHHPINDIKSVLKKDEVDFLRNAIKNVSVDDTIKGYIVSIVSHTRFHSELYLGASPRASINLMKGAMAHALLNGRDYVIPDDVKYLIKDTLYHRLILTSESRVRLRKVDDVLGDIINGIPLPVTKKDEV